MEEAETRSCADDLAATAQVARTHTHITHMEVLRLIPVSGKLWG